MEPISYWSSVKTHGPEIYKQEMNKKWQNQYNIVKLKNKIK